MQCIQKALPDHPQHHDAPINLLHSVSKRRSPTIHSYLSASSAE